MANRADVAVHFGEGRDRRKLWDVRNVEEKTKKKLPYTLFVPHRYLPAIAAEGGLFPHHLMKLVETDVNSDDVDISIVLALQAELADAYETLGELGDVNDLENTVSDLRSRCEEVEAHRHDIGTL